MKPKYGKKNKKPEGHIAREKECARSAPYRTPRAKGILGGEALDWPAQHFPVFGPRGVLSVREMPGLVRASWRDLSAKSP